MNSLFTMHIKVTIIFLDDHKMQICGIVKYENLLKFSQFSRSKLECVATTTPNANIFYLFFIHMQSLPSDPLRTQNRRIFHVHTQPTTVLNPMDTTYSLCHLLFAFLPQSLNLMITKVSVYSSK